MKWYLFLFFLLYGNLIYSGKCCNQDYINLKNKNTYLKFQSSYELETPILGSVFLSLSDKISNLVPGVQVLPRGPGGYVPVIDTEKSIENGSLDCAFTGLSYSFIQNSILELYTSVPFGIEADAFITYIFEKGGLDSLNTEAEKKGVFMYPMCLLPPETGGWFNKEIKSASDFQGIKMRIYGLGRNIIEGLGGTAYFIPQSELINALESGIIDSVEFSTIEIDEFVGLPNVLNYWYSPSWNQLSTVLYFVINLKKWNSLSAKQQREIKIILKENMYSNYFNSNYKQIDFLDKYKTQLRQFNDETILDMKKVFDNFLNKPESFQLKSEYEKIREFQKEYSEYTAILSERLF